MVYTAQQQKPLNFTIENLVVHLVLCMDTAGSGGKGRLLWKAAPRTKTSTPHRILSPTGSHTELGYGSHSAQHGEIILIKIFLKSMQVFQNIAFIPESPFKHDCSRSDFESNGRVRGNLTIQGLLHCISKPREMVCSFLFSYQSVLLQKTQLTNSFHIQFSLPPSSAGSAQLQSQHHPRIKGLESTWSPALTVPHLLIPHFSLFLTTAFDTSYTLQCSPNPLLS